MKKCFSRYRIALFALSIMSSATFADQIWRGTSVSSVLDQDIVIKDDVLLPIGGTRIEAVHKDITITLTKGAKIAGSWAGESQLYLLAAKGRTIRFELDHDLTFVGSGSSAIIPSHDLLVVQSGPGVVEMAIGAGKEFRITSQQGSGGVQMYVLMYGGESAPCDEYCAADEYCTNEEYLCDEYCAVGNGLNETATQRPTLRFVNLANNSRQSDKDNNRYIIVGKKSRLSFLSSRTLDIAHDSGYIVFDPAHKSAGRMVLRVKDTGAFIAAGHYTCQRNGGFITLPAIDLSIPAGKDAIWEITNSIGKSASAGLLVLNENHHLFDLLADPFLYLDTRSNALRAFNNCLNKFSGDRLGVVVGANGTLQVDSDSYLDYVGLALNQVPAVECIPGLDDVHMNRLLKMRNPSALFVDGNNDPLSTPARFSFQPRAAVFFRSGIANDGTVRGLDDIDPFTIDASEHTPGVGNIVFDVEGELNVQGTLANNAISSKIELLSLEVDPRGGALFVESTETNFPIRTFNTEDNQLLAYNTGAFLINNIMNLYDTALSHTDVNHRIVPNNDQLSEPAYIGGETFRLLDASRVVSSIMRPSIRFFNAELLVNADIAVTGLDLVVPNLVDDMNVLQKNNSDFIFYTEGACPSNGNGRNMILGTDIGATAADGCSVISGDAHLDVMQLFNAMSSSFPVSDTDNQTLHLLTAFNNAAISGVAPTAGDSVNTIFLGNASNISIGTNADTTGFNIDTNPWLRIQGNYFSFTTAGGCDHCPNRSNITGQGGIFVDLNGKLSIDPGFLASFCVLVTRTHNGIVDLPLGQVFFCDDLGIINGDMNLSQPADRILVGSGQEVVDLILDWSQLQQDCKNFSPYQPTGGCCQAATVTNVSSLPIIQGTVDNLIIEGSRLGAPATFIIDGGTVRNITFAMNSNSACCNTDCREMLSGEAPVATVVLRNNGTLVLSDEQAGAVGITVIADGSGTIDLAGDITIASSCPFVKGPNFAAGDTLTINSDIAHEIILPASTRLDLRSFNAETDVVQFTGFAQLAVEPAVSIITGLGTLRFAGNSQLLFEAAPNVASFFQAIPHGAHNPTLPPIVPVPAANAHNQYAFLTNFGQDLDNTDAFRIRLMGTGVIELRENAQASLPYNAFVGVESTPVSEVCQTPITDIELRLLDNAQFNMGRVGVADGGVLQVGNVSEQTIPGGSHTVSFTLTIDGTNTIFSMGSKSFLGLGVGIERFDAMDELGNIVANENIVNTLFDVKAVTLNFLAGRFEDNAIASGNDPRASLFAIDGDTSVVYNMNLTSLTNIPFNLAGGANMALVFPGTGGLHPIVLDQDGQVEVAPGVFDPRLWVSIIASSLLQDNTLAATGLTGMQLFELLKTHDAILEPSRPNTFGRANAATLGEVSLPLVNTLLIDTVSQGAIVRGEAFDIVGGTSEAQNRQTANEVGAVFVNIDQATNEVLTVTLIPQV